MSKIGNIPIKVPVTVQIKVNKNAISIKGREGEMHFTVPKVLQLKQEGDKLLVKAVNEDLPAGRQGKKTKSVHGLYRQLLFNAVTGVETPWQKKLEVIGTGFNVKLQGEDLVFKVGYSHPVVFKRNPNIKFQIEGNNKVVVSGFDKQIVGQVAYQIKMIKPPDVYKGKGIRYEGETIKLKPGKKVKTSTMAAA